MLKQKVDEIKIAIDGVAGTENDRARYLIDRHYPLAVSIIEDWLIRDLWATFYGSLTKDVDNSHKIGPTNSQVDVLARMRDYGYTVTPMRGLLRWLDGGDVPNRHMSRSMFEKMLSSGWITMVDSDREGVEYELTITEKGKHALANAELDLRRDGGDRR